MGFKLPDVQKESVNFYKIPVNKVGVRNNKIPFKLKTKNGEDFVTIATISSYCNLVPTLKGINMSRISRSLNEVLSRDNHGYYNLDAFLTTLKKNHGAENVWIKAYFDYIIKDQSPISKLNSFEPVKVIFESKLVGGKLKKYITIKTTEMSLCPCSKEMSLLINNLSDSEKDDLNQIQNNSLKNKIKMSGFGAHNQKSIIEITVEVFDKNIVWIEDLVDIAHKGSSCQTYTTIKREDEKYITEVSYLSGYFNEKLDFIKVEGGGPKFVEDITRDIAVELNKMMINSTIKDYVVVVSNKESIHSEEIEAVATINAGKDLN